MATLAAPFNTADKSAPGHYKPSQTALLLLDFHSMFILRLGGAQAAAALSVAAQMRIWAKAQGIQVVHCLLDINATPFATCKDFERFANVVGALQMSGGEEAAALLQDLDGGNEVTFIRKPGYVSALKSPGLEDFLQKRGIKSLIMAGLSTSGCVMRTAVMASDAEYVVSVISDGCTDPVEGMHDFMVEKVLTQRGYVTSAAEFQEGFAKVNGSGM